MKESASEWLLRVGQVAKRLNEESLGDCRSGTVAGRASPEPASGLGHSATIDYRKEGEQ